MFFVIAMALVFFGLPLLVGTVAYFQKRAHRAFYSHPSGNDACGIVSPEGHAGVQAGFPLKHP
jgi:hypothetical protein